MKWSIASHVFFSCALLLGGCSVAPTAVFMTKSNIGLDIDGPPATAELSIARRQGVVSTTFEAGQTPPFLSGFVLETGFFSSIKQFFLGVQSTFAGGDAALRLVDGKEPSSLCVSRLPQTGGLLKKKDFDLGGARLVLFDVNTILGLKLTEFGSGKLGFNHRESVLAPIIVEEKDCAMANGGKGKYRVQIPSFLAVLSAEADSDDLKWRQYFATGEAATSMAQYPYIREALHGRTMPSQ